LTTSRIDQLVQKIASLQRELNDERFTELRLYRRDTAIYELSSAVNHTLACWLSENYRPIDILVERGRNFIRETPTEDPIALMYYTFAEEFFETVQAALEMIPRAKA
jgi:hypothetical protein